MNFLLCLKMPCLDETLSSSSPNILPKNNDKNMNGVTAEFIENFSTLKLETTSDTKSALERVDKTIGNIRNLPDAKISIQEKNRELVCLSCNKEVCCKESDHIEKGKKVNLPLSSSLIGRSPDRNGRRHCRARPSLLTTTGHRQPGYVNYADNHSLYCTTLSSGDFSSQLLHYNGGHISEAHDCGNQKIQNVCLTNREISPDQFTDINFTDQFSPSSVSSTSSSAYSSSPSSHDYCAPNKTTHSIEFYSEDSGTASPSTSELCPTPPDSAFGNFAAFLDEDDISESLRAFGIAHCAESDDSSLQFPCSEHHLSTTVPEKKDSPNVLSHSSAPKEEIDRIVRYLKDEDVNPITYKGADSSSSLLNNDQQINKTSSSQEQTNNKHVEVSLAHLPFSTVTSQSSVCRSENVTQSMPVILMPVQLQTVPALRRDNHLRHIRPNVVAASETRVEERDGNQQTRERNRINSNISSGEEYKSVKEKISALMTREEKNKLLKSEYEKKPPGDGETRLHLAAAEGDAKLAVKLAYVILESNRTKIKNENSVIDNPRLFLKKQIQKLVNAQNKQGCTPLYNAVFVGNNLLTAYLLECGGDPLIKDHEYGNTPYHIATMKGDNAVVLMELLSYCRDTTNIRNNRGHTILMAAVMNHGEQCSGIKLIKHLLNKNHQVSPQDCNGKTVLHIAVLKKDVELVEVLLMFATDAKKAKLIKDNQGNTILHLAAMLTDVDTQIHKKLLEIIMMHCPTLTEVANNENKLPYQLVNESRLQEQNLLRNKMDKYGFRSI